MYLTLNQVNSLTNLENITILVLKILPYKHTWLYARVPHFLSTGTGASKTFISKRMFNAIRPKDAMKTKSYHMLFLQNPQYHLQREAMKDLNTLQHLDY